MKKIIALLLSVIAVMTSVNTFAIEEEEIATLREYNILQGYEDGSLNLDKNITRAEVCKAVLVAMGYSNDFSSMPGNSNEFDDVAATHWAYGYIHTAKMMSLIDGDGNRNFLPDENITTNDVLKIIINALGYTHLAVEKGGYPAGYHSVAMDLGLISTDINGTTLASRGDVAKMIYVALNTPIMDQVVYGAKSEYHIMDGTDDYPLVTWKLMLDDVDEPVSSNEGIQIQDGVPYFNGEEYTSRIVKIYCLEKTDNGYIFKNALNGNDNATYTINENTYIYINVNTLDLNEIKDGMYALCWYNTTKSLDSIDLLKIELMKEPPSEIRSIQN